MISLYIPKKRWLYNNQYELVDQEGRIVYRHRSNFFRTKRYIVNKNNEAIYHSRTIFGFIDKHAITRNNEIITYVSIKSIWGKGILISKEGFSVKINSELKFSILMNQEEVLSISKSDRKEFSHMIIVDEDLLDFLIILMFTIIVMNDRFFLAD
jgi:hypothetical protein